MKIKTHISLLSARVLVLNFILRFRPSLAMLALGVLASIPSQAETLLWTNIGGGNWNAPANWEPNQVPGASDNAVITVAGTYAVTLNADVNVASLTCGGLSGTQTLSINGGTLTLDSASLAKSNAVINFNGGAITGAGEFVVEGLFLWTGGTIASTGGVTANGTLVIANTTQRDLSGVLRSGGQGRWDAGTLRILYGGVLENLTNGVMDLTFDGSTTTYGVGRTINNAGLWRKSGGTGTATLQAPFNNHGTVEVQSGTLRLAEGGTSSGAFNPASGGRVELSGGTHVLTTNATLGGAGEFRCSGGTVINLALGAGSVTNWISDGMVYFDRLGGGTLPHLVLSGGTLDGTGGVVVSGSTHWTGGTIASTGGVTANGTLVIANTAQRDLSGVLRNGGQGRWDAGVIRILYGGVLENLATGVMDLTFDGSTTIHSGARTIHNAGLWRKSGGTGTATLQASFNNHGMVSVWQGTLAFPEGLNLSSTGTVECALAGVNHPEDYGRITSSQSLPLAGRLAVSFRSGFVPGDGQQYDVIAAPLAGQFQSYTAPAIAPNIFINLVYQPGLVRLVTTDATPVVGKPSFDVQGRAALNIRGIVNQFYAVEASTNLVQWAGLETNSIPPSTVWQFVDEASFTFPQRFYRVRFLP